jgi:hypothetical protein
LKRYKQQPLFKEKASEFNSESANEANKKQIPKAEKEIIR